MDKLVFISGAVEGASDEAMFRRLVTHLGAHVHRIQPPRGKAAIRRALPGLNAAANWTRWLVLVDLDHDFPCPGALVADWLPRPAPFMRLRVSVPEIEAWLMADAERFAVYFGIKSAAVPAEPERVADAKATLVQLATTSSRRDVRLDMVPSSRSGRSVGRAYSSRLIAFVSDMERGWRPDVAATRAPSLAKCLQRLRELIEHGPSGA